jgi:glutamate dehydrogenase (NAD(P)+)
MHNRCMLNACGIRFQNKTAIIQGFGNVGSYAAKYLHGEGVKIIGVLEVDCNLSNPDGIDPEVPSARDLTTQHSV